MAKNPKQQAAIATAMKAAGKTPKRKMKAGGSSKDPGPGPSKGVLGNILGLIGGGSGILAGTILANRDKDSDKAIERDNKRIKRKGIWWYLRCGYGCTMSTSNDCHDIYTC